MTVMQQETVGLKKFEGSPRTTDINGKLYKEKYNKVNQPQETIVPFCDNSSLPITKENCVPTMASAQQIELYENVLNLPNMTVNNILAVFSHSLSQSKIIGKQEFLIDFIDEIVSKNINFDLGVVCCDIYSEDALTQVCKRNGYNNEKLSVLVPGTNTFGLVIKIRKSDRENKPVTRTEIDLCIVYDGAIQYAESTFQQFKNVSSRRPFQRLLLTAMDTPDIRILSVQREIAIDWSTKIRELDDKTKQKLLFQKNRRPSLAHAKTWNKHIAKMVAQWAAKKEPHVPYIFEFPMDDLELKRIYEMFPYHYPIGPKKNKVEETIATDETPIVINDDDDNMDVDEDESSSPTVEEPANKKSIETKIDDTNHQAVTDTADSEDTLKRPLDGEEDENIPNKKQKAATSEATGTEEIDYDLMLKQALADFENEINQL